MRIPKFLVFIFFFLAVQFAHGSLPRVTTNLSPKKVEKCASYVDSRTVDINASVSTSVTASNTGMSLSPPGVSPPLASLLASLPPLSSPLPPTPVTCVALDELLLGYAGGDYNTYGKSLIVKGVPVIVGVVLLLFWIVQLFGLCCSCFTSCCCCLKCCCLSQNAPTKNLLKSIIWGVLALLFVAGTIATASLTLSQAPKIDISKVECSLLTLTDNSISGYDYAINSAASPSTPLFGGIIPIQGELNTVSSLYLDGSTTMTEFRSRAVSLSTLPSLYPVVRNNGLLLQRLFSTGNNNAVFSQNNHQMHYSTLATSPLNTWVDHAEPSGVLGASGHFSAESERLFSVTENVTRQISWNVTQSVLNTLKDGFKSLGDVFADFSFGGYGSSLQTAIIILASIVLAIAVFSLLEVLRITFIKRKPSPSSPISPISPVPSAVLWVFALLVAVVLFIVAGVFLPVGAVFSDVCSIISTSFDQENFWANQASSLFSTSQARNAIKACFMKEGDGNLPSALGISSTFDPRSIPSLLPSVTQHETTPLPSNLASSLSSLLSSTAFIYLTPAQWTAYPSFPVFQYAGIQNANTPISDPTIQATLSSTNLAGLVDLEAVMAPFFFRVVHEAAAPVPATTTYSAVCGVNGLLCRIEHDGTYGANLANVISAVATAEPAREAAAGGAATFSLWMTNGVRHMADKARLRNITTPPLDCLPVWTNLASLSSVTPLTAPLTKCAYEGYADGSPSPTPLFYPSLSTHINTYFTQLSSTISLLSTSTSYTDNTTNLTVTGTRKEALEKSYAPYATTMGARVNNLYEAMQCRDIYYARLFVSQSVCDSVAGPVVKVGTYVLCTAALLTLLYALMHFLYCYLKAKKALTMDVAAILSTQTGGKRGTGMGEVQGVSNNLNVQYVTNNVGAGFVPNGPPAGLIGAPTIPNAIHS